MMTFSYDLRDVFTVCTIAAVILCFIYKGYEVAKDFDPFKTDLTQKLQKVRT